MTIFNALAFFLLAILCAGPVLFSIMLWYSMLLDWCDRSNRVKRALWSNLSNRPER